MANRTVKRRILVNGILVLVAVALVLIVILEPGQEPPPEKPVIAADLAPAAIRRVAILRPDKPAVRFVKRDGNWRMTEPRQLPAAAGKLDDLLQFPGTTSERRYAVTELNPAGLGLDQDALKLKLNDTVFAFGDTDAINGWRYVRTGDTVHLVQGSIYFNLSQDPLEWVSTRLLPPGAEIKALQLPKVKLVQQDGVWTADGKQDISADAIVELVQRWESTRALSVQELGEKPEYSGTVRIKLAERAEPVVFKLIEAKTGFELARPEWELKYQLTEFQYNDLMKVQESESEEES